MINASNDSSQRNISDLASVQSELAEMRAVMQASISNYQLLPPPTNVVPSPSDGSISTAGTRFGRGAHMSYKRQKN